MMKGNRFLIPTILFITFTVVAAIFWSLKNDDNVTEASKVNIPNIENPFFLKGNAYISLHRGETFSLSLPFLFEDSSIDGISAVTFDSNDIEAEMDVISKTGQQYGVAELGYMKVDIRINKAGSFKAQEMTLISGDKSVSVNIGKLVFDVNNDRPSTNLVFSGAAVQTAMDEYTLNIQNTEKMEPVAIKSVTAELASMHLHTVADFVPAGKTISHTLALSGDPERYSWYILKPKVTYTVAGQEKTTSGYPTILQLTEWTQENINHIFENKANSEYK
ncbi:hypothetical protein HB848_09205 [Listeria rocourtiae]|uniref:hypothetical protein n=1 Tax=Listeria rocourtiae TaxID=647910 RepID=UPI0016235D79|nr:hypothetical protein [Listeria rocourtiae]MBC1435517.1 hypothetical protein [Listeria rocourtiae]